MARRTVIDSRRSRSPLVVGIEETMTRLDLQPAPRIPSPLIASNYGTSVSIIGKYRSDA